jgi:hypothetical protein
MDDSQNNLSCVKRQTFPLKKGRQKWKKGVTEGMRKLKGMMCMFMFFP